MKQILQAVVAHALTDKELEGTRASYGTPGDGKFVLEEGAKLTWPNSFRPAVPGWTQVARSSGCEFDRPKPRLLGISLQEFRLDLRMASPQEGFVRVRFFVRVVIFNAGGSANGGVIGGCSLSYSARRVGKRWLAECVEVLDP